MKTLKEIRTELTAEQNAIVTRQRELDRATQHVGATVADLSSWDFEPDELTGEVARRTKALRAIEDEILERIPAVVAVAREHKASVTHLSATIDPAARSAAAELATLYPDFQTLPLAQVERELRAALLREDAGATVFWGRATEVVIRTPLPSTASDADRAAHASLGRLLVDAAERTRSQDGDELSTMADDLRSAATALDRSIQEARRQRGEPHTGIVVGSSRRMVPISVIG